MKRAVGSRQSAEEESQIFIHATLCAFGAVIANSASTLIGREYIPTFQKKRSKSNANRNHSPFTIHHSSFRGMAIPRYKNQLLVSSY